MKKVLGITGGVGAGKSTVLAYLRDRYGAQILECDAIGRMLQQPGEACWQPMLELFTDECLLPDGTWDRAKIARIIFTDEEKREKLNRIVHPAVKQYVKDRVEDAENDPAVPFTVVEAALLLEDHYDLICDEIWYIYTDPEVRRERLRSSRGYSDEKIDAMNAALKSDVYFREHCALTVDNSASDVENTYNQIDKGLNTHGIL